MSDDEKAIRELQRKWIDATNRGDVTELLSFMSEDVIFLRPRVKPIGRDEFATEFINACEKVTFQCEGMFEEVVVEGDFAYARARLTATITPVGNGAPMHFAGKTLSVFRKLPPGDWLLVRDANLIAPIK